MDTPSLGFRYEEHFSNFESSDFLNLDDDSQSMEAAFAIGDNEWEWEVEREINGDIALIPMSSGLDMNYLSNSPPIRGDFQNIMSELHIDVPEMETLTTGIPLLTEGGHETYITDITPSSLPALDIPTSPSSFDLLEYANDENNKKSNIKMIRPSGKKIDMNAQCYILEENDVVAPKLELSDFSDEETSFITPKTEEIDIVDEEILTKCESQDNNQHLDVDSNESENDYIDVDTISEQGSPILQAGDLDTISEQGSPILQAGDLNSLLEQFEATETSGYFEPGPYPPTDRELFEQKSSEQNATSIIREPTISELKKPAQNSEEKNDAELDKNKQILDALPQELIMRIKASSKRKVIPVIDPIPSKKRGGTKKVQPEVQSAPQTVQIKEEKVTSEFVQLDHDYCSQTTPYPKHPKKDSGFESAEEEEQRNILRNQPTFKGANGKLMVSLLKINTIRNSIASESDASKKKRKLNLEEYKKRREGFMRSCDNSQSNSPINSGRNSPVTVEDENARLIKHQQKLMQMAAEVLKTPPKSACKTMPSIPSTESLPQVIPPKAEGFIEPPPPRIPPDNIEVKVLVSIGVNTDVTSQNVILAAKPLQDPAVELEEIRPILENANAKINNNSLITSVIENIRHKKKLKKTAPLAQTDKPPKEQHHGEDKIIAYLDKSRPVVATKSVEIQTEETGDTRMIRKRRRSCSSSSSDHRKSYKRRSGSNDSRYSYSSQSSSSYSSRSRSRSPSPKRVYHRKRTTDTEHLREVEERRIIFVGGLSSSMTKETLRRRFEQFGPIGNVSLHFREIGDNYGFVTFLYKEDAYAAVEHGNDDPMLPHYDISFGGRRIFCGAGYSDLDNVQDDLTYSSPPMDDSFDNLLREAQAKLRKRKAST